MSIENSNQDVEREIVDVILRLNPHLKLGDRMTAPVALVYDGKIGPRDDELGEPIVAKVVKINLPVNDFELAEADMFLGDYLHIYECLLPNKNKVERLRNMIGQTIKAIDCETLDEVMVTIDQSHIDKFNVAILRFSLSCAPRNG